jgi:hypothetical protein
VRDRKNDHKHKQRTEFGGEADHGEFGAERTVEARPPRNNAKKQRPMLGVKTRHQ